MVRITAAQQVGQRWYYAFVEQWPQPQISASGDATAAKLYEDHPNARTGVIPGDGIGPYLTEINNRQLNVGDLVQVRHKTETPVGTVFEAEAGGGTAAPVTYYSAAITSLTPVTIQTTAQPTQNVTGYQASVSPFGQVLGGTYPWLPRSTDTWNAYVIFGPATSAGPQFGQLYWCRAYSTSVSGGMPVYVTDNPGPFQQITTPATFLDDPSGQVLQLAESINQPATPGTFRPLSSLVFGAGYLVLGGLPGSVGPPITFPTSNSLYTSAVSTSGSPPSSTYTTYKGDSGTDPNGSQVVNGLVVAIGTGTIQPNVSGSNGW